MPVLRSFVLILLLVLISASCRANDPGTAPSSDEALPLSSAPSPTPLPPVVISSSETIPEDGTESSAQDQKNDSETSEDLSANLESMANPTASHEESTATADAPENQTLLTEENAEPARETVSPTYTAPAAPEASPWDHYWLRRPVPSESAVWTDKAYSFGSTRGGLLRPHHGVEFNVTAGTDVIASADGIVEFAGRDDEMVLGPDTDFYGSVVVLRHGFLHNDQPVFTLYGHLSEINVQEGQSVKSGETIAQSGSSGVADGAHLHFEVRVGDNAYPLARSPLLWLYPFPDHGVVAGAIRWPSGSNASEVPISLRRLDAPSSYKATTTYPENSVSSDLNWNENFALDDVEAGYYQLTIGIGENKQVRELWVYPGVTNFVDIVLDQN